MGSVAVVGGSLSGIAAALRLARVGHQVCLIEAGTIGGYWLDPCAWPDSLTVVAAWRDLFRKTGKPLDAVLASYHIELQPAPATVHKFDQFSVELPHTRGVQESVIARRWGAATAAQWTALMDKAEHAWQAWRKLGLEADQALNRTTLSLLQPKLSWNKATAMLGEAAELLAPLRWPYSSEEIAWWPISELATTRAVGAWRLTHQHQPISEVFLIEQLQARLKTRGVGIIQAAVLECSAKQVRTTTGDIHADAVLLANHPWSEIDKKTAKIKPALGPRVTIEPCQKEEPTVIEHATRRRRRTIFCDGEWVQIVQDFQHPVSQPELGIRWLGPKTWFQSIPIIGKDGIFRASAASRAGGAPWGQLLSGALATYAIHEYLTGESIRPVDDPRRSQHRT